MTEPLRLLLRAGGRSSGRFTGRINLGRLAAMLDLDPVALRATLAKRAPLRALRLVDYENEHSDLEDFVSPADLLREVMDAAPEDGEALLALLIEPAPGWNLGTGVLPPSGPRHGTPAGGLEPGRRARARSASMRSSTARPAPARPSWRAPWPPPAG